ncbi:uncharacterized protein G2W53_004776 [Senna tora]|uniref:Uncharacterized protein n=1 Tax=Senna tora TaxID=362788 RepID=A0A834XDF6_9FABA|nr:uncharacterized protein G2W53_004776 [Senna tora]
MTVYGSGKEGKSVAAVFREKELKALLLKLERET